MEDLEFIRCLLEIEQGGEEAVAKVTESVWQRTYWHSSCVTHLGEAPAGPFVCDLRRTGGWWDGWKSSYAQGTWNDAVSGSWGSKVNKTAMLDIQRADFFLFGRLKSSPEEQLSLGILEMF